jgi:two-component system, OmpR family, sensor histidine kinase TctE
VTIARRLLMMVIPALIVLMVAGAMIDYRLALIAVRNTSDRALADAARAAVQLLGAGNGVWVLAAAQHQADAGAPPTDADLLYAVAAPDGHLVAGSALLPRIPGAGNPSFGDARIAGRELRVATLRVPTTSGTASITVAAPTAYRAQALRAMLSGHLLVDFFELDGVTLLLWIGVYYSLRPVRQLGAQVESRSVRELQHIGEAQVPAEVRPLIVAVNRLLELLHIASGAQQRFIADAAHQLRTPLAGLLAQLELLLSKPAAAGMQADLSTLRRALQHVAHSANQLLVMARAEPMTVLLERLEPVGLVSLIGQIVERNLDRADLLKIDLGADVHPAEVLGDAWLLEDLLNNLVDNALNYTPAGGHVTVRCGDEAGVVFLEVEDDGPGIPQSERLRVRERFYRLPGSPGAGSGLGLAIVEQIARVHGADLSIETASGGQGARLRVSFRRPARAAS